MTIHTSKEPESYCELMPCEDLENCPLFDQFRYQEARDFWIRLYCRGILQSTCRRKWLSEMGRPVPAGMLPNGKIL